MIWTEQHTGTARAVTTPHDDIVQTRSSVRFNCTVEGMRNQDNLIWWHHNVQTNVHTKLFESNPSSEFVPVSPMKNHMELDTNTIDFEIIGSYDILVKNVDVQDSGRYVCELVNLQNYTADLTVVGTSSMHFWFINSYPTVSPFRISNNALKTCLQK